MHRLKARRRAAAAAKGGAMTQLAEVDVAVSRLRETVAAPARAS